MFASWFGSWRFHVVIEVAQVLRMPDAARSLIRAGRKDTKPALESPCQTIRLRPYLGQEEVVDALVDRVIATVDMVESDPVEGDSVVEQLVVEIGH